MFVCVCNALTEKDIRRAIDSGTVRTVESVYRFFDTEPQCGQCMQMIDALLAEAGIRQAATPAPACRNRHRRRAVVASPHPCGA